MLLGRSRFALRMPRQDRVQIPGFLYHITTRGNDGQDIVLDDIDRRACLFLLESTVDRYRLACRAYCIMYNHLHLVVEPREDNLDAAMCFLFGKYARRFNRRHARRDHLFGRRYYSGSVERGEHAIAVARYVAGNPLLAGICDRPEEYKWSSYAATVGLAPMPRFLEPGVLLDQFGPTPELARGRFMSSMDTYLEECQISARPGSWHRVMSVGDGAPSGGRVA